MFARQIAVMKGQAWNVVETLKQPDHGPLELTRRMRVCVWDDLVDIPVAIPLRVPSTEMQYRRAQNRDHEEEEMDISTAMDSEPRPQQQQDLLNMGSPIELPNPNRFELSRSRGSLESGRGSERETSPVSLNRSSFGNMDHLAEHGRDLASSWSSVSARPRPRGYKSNMEYGRRNRKRPSRRRDSALPFAGDDLEGDLGYAAARDMDGNERKVIVERLEAVKSRNPFFTWC
jgi:hypothetical protein